ncbi:MAG TPA: MFS transporter [Methylomirabilota bacterium]|jgi:MFS family permease|nr:MFS transporter [Methylomirabilota bacterium]
MKATRGGLHHAWVVLGALVVVMLLGSGLRAVFGVFIKPMEATFGWDRAALSGAAAISLLLLGAAGPIVGWLADQWGPRRVIFVSAILLGLGAMLSSRVSALWQIYITCGVLMGLGAGGVGMSTGAALAARWFEARRGLVMGLVGGAMSAGQLVIVPLAVWFTLSYGWRQSFLYLGVLLLVIALPLTLLFIRDDPAQKGLKAYGAGQAARAGEPKAPPEGRTRVADAMQVPAFWLLAGTFFICGYTSNGLVLTHLVPHAAEHGFSEMHAAQALGVMGAMNILGTVASGFICDRFGRKGPLAFYYGVRGLSLLFLLYVWNVPSLHIFAAIFGLNYISTVPPTTTLTANIFGRYSVGSLSGWIFFAHQVGAALGAAVGGWVFQSTGSYSWAFISAALLAFLAVPMALAIKEAPVTRTPQPTPAPAGLPATAS